MRQKSLLECRGDEVAEMSRDNFHHGDFCLLTDGFNVWLSEQAAGEKPVQKIRLPKAVFDSLVREYVKPRTPK